MSHFTTLNRSVRAIQATSLFSEQDFELFERLWIKPWGKIVELYKRWPTLFEASDVHRLHLVKTLEREAHRYAKAQREELEILGIRKSREP